jgi:DNA-binding CsgD family transcriptional regulator/PAS domain-containing protein
MNCADYIDDRALARSEYFTDYILPAGRRYLLGAYPYKESGVTSAFAVMRAPGKPPFSSGDSALLAYLMPHLSRAARLDRRLQAPRKAEGTLSAALDNLTDALFVVDAKGRIVRTNGRAVEMLDTGDTLLARAGRLRTRQTSKAAQLSTLIASAASTNPVAPSDRSGTVVLEAPDNARCAVLIAPLMPSATLFDLADQRLVLIVASQLKALPSVAWRLAQAFSLTPAEARLADRIVAGATLDDIASEFNVRLPTLNSQLKSIFLKTGTRRQGQLMQLGAQMARLREFE